MKILTNKLLKRKHAGTLSVLLTVSALLLGASAVFAQNARLELSQLDKLAKKAKEVTTVNLEGPMLKLAANQMSQNVVSNLSNKKGAGTSGVANLLHSLKGIYVKSFEFSKPGEYTKADLDSVMNQLQAGGWKAILHVQEKKSGETNGSETTGIYTMEEGGQTVGMAIVAAEPKELTVVNLVGPIDFSQLGGLRGLGALGALGGLAGSMGDSSPQLQHRRPTPPKDKSDSK